MPNLVTGDGAVNCSKVCRMIGENDYELQSLSVEQSSCSLLMNIFASEGKPGKVLRVKAKNRTGGENFVTCMRKAVEKKYGTDPVGLGGVFRLTSGAAKCHVMPPFSEKPLVGEAEVNKWLKFYDMKAPMVFFSVLVSSDPGLNLRLDHSHGYGEKY